MPERPLLAPGEAAPGFCLPAVNRDGAVSVGVQMLAVVNTPLDRARLYFGHRPARVLLAADPDAATHRAYGIPAFEFVEEAAASRWPARVTMREFQAVSIRGPGRWPRRPSPEKRPTDRARRPPSGGNPSPRRRVCA